MRLVFVGLYNYGAFALQGLLDHGEDVVGIVTKPTPLAEEQPLIPIAVKHGLPMMQPNSPRDPSFVHQIQDLMPDLIAVVGYHKVIPREVLDIPTWGTINTHPSLLPRYRGPVPHKWVIIKGEQITGITIHMMTPRLDDGDILSQLLVPIDIDDTADTLIARLTPPASELLVETIRNIRAGKVQPMSQNHANASYFSFPSENETHIDWHLDTQQIRNLIRGLSSRPGAWSSYHGKRLTILGASPVDSASRSQPGTILSVETDGITIATGTNDLLIFQLLADGQPIDNLEQFGFQPGEILET